MSLRVLPQELIAEPEELRALLWRFEGVQLGDHVVVGDSPTDPQEVSLAVRRDPSLQLIGVLPDRFGDRLHQLPLLGLSRELARNDEETLRRNRRREHSPFAVENVSRPSRDFLPRDALIFDLRANVWRLNHCNCTSRPPKTIQNPQIRTTRNRVRHASVSFEVLVG